MTEESKGMLTRIADAASAVVWGTWHNARTGRGDPARDKNAGSSWRRGIYLDPETARSLFDQNDLAYTIVTALPEWGLRHGLGVRLEPPEDGEQPSAIRAHEVRRALADDARRLDMMTHLIDAATWGGLYGGGLLLIGADDGRPTSEPLDLSRLASIDWLRVSDRTHAQVDAWDTDPASGRYGQPERYRIFEATHGPGAYVQGLWHHSRVIVFPGARTSARTRRENGGWDLSVLDRVVSKLSLHDGIWADVGSMVADGSQGVWKIKGFFNAILSNRVEQLESRFAIADKARSIYRAILLDKDGEEFSYVHRQFSGIEGLLSQSAIRTAAAAQMPVTVLFGQSPGGMNATGDSDLSLWYDRVKSYRTHTLEPRISSLLRIMFAAAEGPTGGEEPSSWGIQWPPVREPSRQEVTNERHQQAQTDMIYHDLGVFDAATIAANRFGPNGYSVETVIEPARLEAMLEEADDDDDEPEGVPVPPGQIPAPPPGPAVPQSPPAPVGAARPPSAPSSDDDPEGDA